MKKWILGLGVVGLVLAALLIVGKLTGVVGFRYLVVENNDPLFSPVTVVSVSDKQVALSNGLILEIGALWDDPNGRLVKVGERVDLDETSPGRFTLFVSHPVAISNAPWAHKIPLRIIPVRVPGNVREEAGYGREMASPLSIHESR